MSRTVSILIPCYNSERWINQTLQSAVDQNWQDCEVIVIDDGSTDRSAELLRSWGEQVTVHLRENRGGNPTRNELLKMASGQWVQFLDADDYLLPEKISHQMAIVEQHPDAGVIYSPLIIEHHVGESFTSERWDPHDPLGDHDPWTYHLSWSLTQTGGALFHKEKLLAAGGWNEDQSCCQDNEVFFRLLKQGARFIRCEEAEAVYRRFRDGTVSTGYKPHLLVEILRLLDEGETFLKKKEALTAQRQEAVDQMRFRMARSIWPGNPQWAKQIMQKIRTHDSGFYPKQAPHCPRAYQIAYRLLGFAGAERISSLKRRVKRI